MDEHGEVGRVVSVAESSTVTVTVSRSDKTLVENMGAEGQQEGSYNGGDGEEIMVEVVGSDVFVDGVSGDDDGLGKEGLAGREMESFGNDNVVEGETGSREVGVVDGQVWEGRTETRADEEVVGVSDDRAESSVAMEGVGMVIGSTSEETHVVAKRVELTVTEKGEEKREDMELVDGDNNAFGGSVRGGVLDDEVWNPGIDAMAGGQQDFVAEEGAVKVQEQDLSYKDEIPGVQDRLVVEMNENISKASTEDGANHASSEFSNHPTESAVKGNVGVVSTEETSQSPIGVTVITVADKNLHTSGEGQQMKDNPVGKTNANHEILDTDSLSFKPLNDSSGCEVAVVDQVSSIHNQELLDSVAVNSGVRDGGVVAACTDSGSSDHVHISPDQSAVHKSNNSASLSGNHLPSSGEVLASESRLTSAPTDDLNVGEHEVKVKPMSDLLLGTEPEDADGETQVVMQEENLARAGRDSGAEPEASSGPTAELDVGEHKVEGRCISEVALGSEPNYAIVETEGVEQEEDPVGTSVGSGLEPEACDDTKNENRSYSEDLPSKKQEAASVHAIPESSNEPSSVVERGEWIGMDIDEVLDLKDEATGLDAATANLSSSVNAESFSGQSTRSTDQVDIADFPITDVESDTKGDHMLEEPVRSQFKPCKEHQHVAAGDAEVISVKEGTHFREEVLDGGLSPLENEKLDIGGGTEKEVATDANLASSNEQIGSVTPMELVEAQGAGKVLDSDAVDKRSSHLAEGNDLKDEKMGVFIGLDAFPGKDSPKGAEAGLLDASVQGMDLDVEASSSVEDKKQDEAAVFYEGAMHEADFDQSKDKFADDKVSKEAADNSPISDVQASSGCQFSADFTGFHGEGNIASSLPDGNQNLNIIGVGEDKSVFRADQTVGTSVFEIVTSGEALNQATKREDECCKADDHKLLQAVLPEAKSVEGQQIVGVGEHNDCGELFDNEEQDMVIAEHASETDESKILEKETLKSSSSLRIHQLGYLPPPENEGEFSTSDLVWGKVRSHPWWPGQIFDPADASEKAVKYYKKDCFLVSYFGDRTFAWNDASVLKPFRSHFSQIEKQSNSEVFQNAVTSALDEVSRRVELGLSCSCIPRDAYEKIECQIVENTGIREESVRRYGVDISSGTTSFEPDKLIQYIRLLAQSPFSMADRLELTLANAQLSAFCRFKGYRSPPTFMSEEESLENDAGTSKFSDEANHTLPVSADGEQVPSNTFSLKRKLSLKDSSQPKKKERSLSELMGDMAYSPDDEDDFDGKALSKSVSTSSGKKRKAVDPVTDGSDRRISIYAAKVSTTSSSPKPSFKVGDCIRRIASQLTGSASILKGNDQQGSDASLHISDNSQRGNMLFPTDISLEEMLSQLQLAARDPKKGYSFLNNIILYFSVFRNSVVSKHASGRSGSGRKKKTSNAAGGSTEEFEFDDVNDSYWTDRIVHNYSEEQLLQNGENGDGDYTLTVSDPDKFHKPSRRSYSRKQYSNGNYETSAEETAEEVERRKLSPAELVLTFAEGDSLPSEINLNKMFRRFGPLKESETEVDQDSQRARVVFKRGSDAEVAHSSAGTFKIFGPKLVSYQLSYSPSTTFRVLPLLLSQGQEDAP